MRATVDGNEAAASVAYRLNEVCCIYPITPSSPMAELADEWSSKNRPNLLGGVPSVVEMQHEGGAAGALTVSRSLLMPPASLPGKKGLHCNRCAVPSGRPPLCC